MHFSKTYAQLLLALPPELSETAIEYRKLKRLIHDIVNELESIGLSPSVLQQLLQHGHPVPDSPLDPGDPSSSLSANEYTDTFPKVVYELSSETDKIEPRLRFFIPASAHASHQHRRPSFTGEHFDDTPEDPEPEDAVLEHGHEDEDKDASRAMVRSPDSPTSLLYTLQRGVQAANQNTRADKRSSSLSNRTQEDAEKFIHGFETHDLILNRSEEGSQELIVPLVYDSAFYHLLSTALQSLAEHLQTIQTNFIGTLQALSNDISHAARPLSASTTSFNPHSHFTDPSTTQTPLFFTLSPSLKSDLYAWREILQIYVESEVFQSLNERERGERTVEDSEARLKAFAERVTGRGLGDRRTLKLKESRAALETFLRLNVLLLDLKKFQLANAEATRKILKKHAKRTALPLPLLSFSPGLSSALISRDDVAVGPLHDSMTLLVPSMLSSLPRTLVQAVGETLLPIIPHVDDYSCLICTSIAFKPIRLFCGHLFCVRCLVKMQKRGSGNCPMCRAPTVIQANRSNVDWALLNFMQDWFPEEAREKLRNNEREAAAEEMEELGFKSDSCVIC